MIYIKKYAQGFLFGFVLSIFDEVTKFPWNEGEWKDWLAFVLVVPVILYFFSDFSKDFAKVRIFSKESIFMYIFSMLGMISFGFVAITKGVFNF
ncbi:MAG TPA: hypothetical protein VNU45_18225 [Rummeliibacillus sp.]|nr:hypothetical protein [Rummeliibacillus sp.]